MSRFHWLLATSFLSSLAQDFIEDMREVSGSANRCRFLSSLAQDFIEDCPASTHLTVIAVNS